MAIVQILLKARHRHSHEFRGDRLSLMDSLVSEVDKELGKAVLLCHIPHG